MGLNRLRETNPDMFKSVTKEPLTLQETFAFEYKYSTGAKSERTTVSRIFPQ